MHHPTDSQSEKKHRSGLPPVTPRTNRKQSLSQLQQLTPRQYNSAPAAQLLISPYKQAPTSSRLKLKVDTSSPQSTTGGRSKSKITFVWGMCFVIGFVVWTLRQQIQMSSKMTIGARITRGHPSPVRHQPRVVHLLADQSAAPHLVRQQPALDVRSHDIINTDKEVYPSWQATAWQPYDTHNGTRICSYMADWQAARPLTCNTVHELPTDEYLSHCLGRGSFRSVYKISEDAVLKMKNYNIGANRSYEYLLEKHRIDAVVADRMTSRPDFANAYASCGNAVVNEALPRTLRSFLQSRRFNEDERMELALNIADAVAALHSLDSSTTASIAHADLHGNNIMMAESEKGLGVKIHDFNQGELGKIDAETGEACKYKKSYIHNYALESAPERDQPTLDMSRLDVFRLGHILLEILTQRWMRTQWMSDNRHGWYASQHQRLWTPDIPDWIPASNSTAIRGIFAAVLAAKARQPSHRPSARQLASALRAVAQLHQQQQRGGGPVVPREAVTALFEPEPERYRIFRQ